MSNDNATPGQGAGGLDWSHMNAPVVPGIPPAAPAPGGDIVMPPKPAPPRYAPPQAFDAPPAHAAPARQAPPYAAPPYANAQFSAPSYGAVPQGVYAPPVMPRPRPAKGVSVTAGWLGIGGAAIALIPFFGIVTWMLPLAAVIVGIVALSKGADGKGWAITGLVLGLLGMFVLPSVSLILGIVGYSAL